MKKKIMVYATCVIAAAFAACTSNETYEKQAEGTPIQVRDTTNIEKSKKIFSLGSDKKSGFGHGFGWNVFNGIISINTTDPESPLNGDYENGGISRSDGRVLRDTVPCGKEFIDPEFTLEGEPVESEANVINPLVEEKIDSIGMLTTKQYTGTDGQTLTLEDLYQYLNTESTISWPFFVPSSKVADRAPVRYDYNTGDENVRIVWVTVEVMHTALNAENGGSFNQTYEVGYYQKRDAAVTPEDPFEVRLNNFDLFRTYRKKTQHSICEGFMSFAVYNARTGELVEEISTDGFSSQLAKCGHFGAPTNGYIVREASLLGSAPTSVTENVVADNEEALSASYVKGNFKLTVTCTSQDYYVHFPVRGRDDSEGGIAAGGQNLFFTATCVYTNPETGWTKTWEFTHRTEVNVKGWEQRTPQVDRTGETVNDVDGVRNLRYAGSYVVEFINHLYLNGEEVVQENGNDDYYFQSSKVNGSTSPFHTSDMVIDCWTSYLP